MYASITFIMEITFQVLERKKLNNNAYFIFSFFHYQFTMFVTIFM